jgi:hypothetical protein
MKQKSQSLPAPQIQLHHPQHRTNSTLANLYRPIYYWAQANNLDPKIYTNTTSQELNSGSEKLYAERLTESEYDQAIQKALETEDVETIRFEIHHPTAYYLFQTEFKDSQTDQIHVDVLARKFVLKFSDDLLAHHLSARPTTADAIRKELFAGPLTRYIDTPDQGIQYISLWLDAVSQITNDENQPWALNISPDPSLLVNTLFGVFLNPPSQTKQKFEQFQRARFKWIEPTRPNQKLPTKPINTGTPNCPSVTLMMALTSNSRLTERFTQDPNRQTTTYQDPNIKDYTAIRQAEIDPTLTDEEKIRRLWQLTENTSKTTYEDALTAAYVLTRLMKAEDGQLRIGITELLNLENKIKLDKQDRDEKAQHYHQVFTQWSEYAPYGQRKWRDPSTGEQKTIFERDPLFIYQGPFYLCQPTLPTMASYPEGYVFVDSTATKQLRTDPALCQFIGDLNQIAQIPGGKTPLDWAKVMAMTGNSSLRSNASKTGPTRTLTRKHLLTRFLPNTTVDEILKSTNPKRARQYFTEACDYLKEHNIMKIDEPAAKYDRQRWADKWLNESVTVTLLGQSAETATRIKNLAPKGRSRK